MLQIVILLNVFQDLAMLPGQEDIAYSSKDYYKKNLQRIDEKGMSRKCFLKLSRALTRAFTVLNFS